MAAFQRGDYNVAIISAPIKSSTTPSSAPCHLLSLPPELRNNIYELAFATGVDANTEVDLLTAAGPPKDLLLSCRQIYNEAVLIHKQAYRQYWETTNFTLILKWNESKPGFDARIKALDDKDIQRVRQLTLSLNDSEAEIDRFTLIQLENGKPGWRHQDNKLTNPLLTLVVVRHLASPRAVAVPVHVSFDRHYYSLVSNIKEHSLTCRYAVNA